MIRLEMKAKNVISKEIRSRKLEYKHRLYAHHLRFFLDIFLDYEFFDQFPNICFLNSRFYDPPGIMRLSLMKHRI